MHGIRPHVRRVHVRRVKCKYVYMIIIIYRNSILEKYIILVSVGSRYTSISTDRIFWSDRNEAARRRRSIGIRVKHLGRLATRLGHRHDLKNRSQISIIINS